MKLKYNIKFDIKRQIKLGYGLLTLSIYYEMTSRPNQTGVNCSCLIKTLPKRTNLPRSYSQNAAEEIRKNLEENHSSHTFPPNGQVSRPNLLWSCDRAFHACFRRFSKDTVSPLSVNCSLLLSWSRAGNGHRFLNDFSTPDGTSTCRSRRTGWNVGLAGVRKVRMYMWTSLNVSQVSRVQSIENKIMRFGSRRELLAGSKSHKFFLIFRNIFVQRCNIKLLLFLQFSENFKEREVDPRC